MPARWRRKAVQAAAAGALALILAAAPPGGPSRAAAAAVATEAESALSDDAFHTPPDPLPAGRPGDLIRYRPAKAGPPSAQALADAWQVMYLSTDALGEPNAVTGTVLVPKGADPATAPVVGFGPGTHGPAFHCAPSRMLAIGAFYEQPAVNSLLGAGYAVALTDYEGYHPDPETTYTIGRSMGAALIDGVRAAQRLTEAGLSATAPVFFRGYSQGGGAAMWAGELQPAYAPELDLAGVIGGGVPADQVQVALGLEGGDGFGLLAYALLGMDNAYPELDLEPHLNDTGRAAFADMNARACTMELLLEHRGKRVTDYLTRSPLIDPPWLARIQENTLGTRPIAAPVFQYHATEDELVASPQARSLRDAYCAAGVELVWKTWQTGHIALVYHGNAEALAFMNDRLSGQPVPSTC
ncbi:lipase family protein [Streptomyces sp. YIM 98790]|uniref:lipase family protein n=1 Tax=Streptomyces sp. YIM 98790 TaxID=2689077 RepID=UPI001A9E6596|nr:lipase family protein [Streptomyces sp. YIM 98790]